MARAPLLQLSEISLTFGGEPLFEGVSVVVHTEERLALVGRNGSGKSTLMKLMAGLIEPDTGTRTLPQGVHAGYMEQDPDLSGFATLGDFARSGLAPEEYYRLEVVAEGLKFDSATPVSTASGGERRRAALAKILAEAPELLLLDEPTNHLDIEAIEWLEKELQASRAGIVLISHDRALLRNLTRATLWLDRGVLRRREAGFEGFEDWRDQIWAEEDEARHKLDRKIKAEARWAVEGISARRKRNMGRVRALQALKADRAGQVRRQGNAALELETGPVSGRLVIDAKHLAKRFGDRTIIRDFSLRVMRGERIAFVGPNGVGKTTLINMLTGQVAPDEGEVTLGTGLELAVLDQNRARLDPDSSLWENLTGDPLLNVSGMADQVMVRGRPRHVVGYLKDFLFDEQQARQPVHALSGGEKARLLLARLMAQPANLLILDEPTNDLDVETLDLLQEVLGDFDGTILLVSHDRDFIDRIATRTVVLERGGKAVIYSGGWSDYLVQRPQDPGDEIRPDRTERSPQRSRPEPVAPASRGLSFTEQKRLDDLPAVMERLEFEIGKLNELLADPDLFTADPVKFRKAGEMLVARQGSLARAEEEWLSLAERLATNLP